MKQLVLIIIIFIITLNRVYGQEGQHNIKIVISNITNSGKIYISLYNINDTFLDDKNCYKTAILTPSNINDLTFEIPFGEYAIAIFQDLNNNEVLDKNIFGIPKEPYGFSNNFKPSFSSPTFQDCKINFEKDNQIVNIKLIK